MNKRDGGDVPGVSSEVLNDKTRPKTMLARGVDAWVGIDIQCQGRATVRRASSLPPPKGFGWPGSRSNYPGSGGPQPTAVV